MSDKSKIEWTEASWNPITGCTKVSPGCKNCYAEREWDNRLRHNKRSIYYDRDFTDVQCHPERLEQPLRWAKSRLIFVNSMSDLFHESVPFEFIAAIYGVIAATPQHTYQILTKRIDRAIEFYNWLDSQDCGSRTEICWQSLRYEAMITGDNGILHTKLCADPDGEWPLSNLWFGISAEDQETANKRIPLLFQILSAVRWVSAEPLLSNIDFVGPGYFADPVHMEAGGLVGIDWVVLGGESGPNARHMELGWARSIRDQCLDAGVPFFFKQWGEYVPGVLTHEDAEEPWREYQNGNRCWGFSEVGQKDLPEIIYSRVGKKKAGRQLDGEIHSEYPV